MAKRHKGYNKYLNCDVETIINPDTVEKIYYDLSDNHWNRILAASAILAKHYIGVNILKVENEGIEFRSITYEKIIPFNNYAVPKELMRTSIYDIQDMITNLVDKMHKLGYGHGDLHILNLGVKNGEIRLLDYDTVYELSDLDNLSNHKWLESWIIDRYDGDFDYFVVSDYESWKTDWLE